MSEQLLKAVKEQIEKAVREQIEKSVNGGIRGIDKKLSDHINNDTEWKKLKDKRDVDNQPAIDNMKNLSNGWKFILSILGSIMVVGGAIVMVKKVLGL